MSITVVTPPTAEPVTLEEAKTHIRAAGCGGDCEGAADVELLAFIKAATEHCEMITRRRCMPQTLRWTIDCFEGPTLRFPVAPVQSVTSIVYRDSSGVSRTLAADGYRSDVRGEPARITPTYLSCWPSTRGEIGDVEIEFVAGYASAVAVPETMKLAIKQLTAHFFANRENVNVGNIVSEIPWTVDALLSGLRWSGYP